MKRKISLVLFALVACLQAACGDGPDTASTTAASDIEHREASDDGLSEEEALQLEALGYIDYSPTASEDSQSGVVIREPSCFCAGFYLVTYPGLGRAELIDPDGRVRQAWAGSGAKWERASLTPGGDLLVLAKPTGRGNSGPPPRQMIRLAFDGREIWTRSLPVHHRIQLLPDGRITSLTSRLRKIERFGTTMIDNGVAILSPRGQILSEWSIYDMLAARPDLFEFVEPRAGHRQDRDFLHANNLHWMPGGELAARDPMYATGNVLVTLPMQNALAIFDLEAQEVVWTWGQGEVAGLHDAQVLEDGRILLFDNRSQYRSETPTATESWSRVLEIDPVRRAIVWEYRGEPPQEFYSRSRGTVQRLERGITLVGASNQGRVFEVTPEGEVVWEYRTPHLDPAGHRSVLRVEWYPGALLEDLLG